MGGGVVNELEARLILSAGCELGDPVIGRAVRLFGAVTVASAIESGSGADVGCPNANLRSGSVDPEQIAARELGRAARAGISVFGPGDAGWPTQLDDLGDRAPLVLRCTGSRTFRATVGRSVAIVGSRSCTRYGAELAQVLAADLAQEGFCVISGGAFGIDANAHIGAMAADGITVAVIAGGADEPSPRGNWRIFDRLRETGAILSEAPLGMRPARRHFLVRNRLIAALARATVIVEAGSRSGAARTASEANSLGRVVAAVPGPVTSEMSKGCHRLIREQEAVLVRDAGDIIELITPLGRDRAHPVVRPGADRVLQMLTTSGPVSVEELATRLDIGGEEALIALVSLREQGRAKENRNGWIAGVPAPG